MSAKTSNQPGRRTPLSLSGGITKGGQSHNNKGGNSGNNANGHNTNKQENKNQQHNKTEQQQTNSQKQQQTADTKDNPTKLLNKQAVPTASESKIPKPQQQQNSDNTKSQKLGSQNDKKQQLAVEKQQQQNGVPNNHKISGNQQQQQQNNNDKQQNDNEKDNKKSETTQGKSDNDEKEKNTTQEKSEKDDKKHKNDKKKQELKKDEENKKEENKKEENKKEENKKEENKKEDNKKDENKKEENKKEENKKEEDIILIEDETEENTGFDNKTSNVPEKELITKGNIKVAEENLEQMDVIQDVAPHQKDEQQKHDPPKSAPPTPKSLKESKPPTPNKPISTKTEKTPQKCTPTKREVTTCIDDFEMEPLNLERSPTKVEPKEKVVAGLAPCSTSTPVKIVLPKPLAKTDVQLAMQPSATPERPRAFSQISGRRAIRQTTEYTPSKFQCNPQFRESYRRINTELDATNTSLNVTVGSEIPNNASFSFFGRGRKRERTPPQLSQSAIGDVKTTEMEISPPKRARLDFFSVVSSPLSLLRNRFSKATLQSSTPVKLQQKLEENEDDIEVQNVSGVSVHEDIEKSAEDASEYGDASFGAEVGTDNIPIEGELEITDNGNKELSSKSADKQMCDDGDIKITETLLQPMTGDPTAKNKRCIVM